MSCNWVITKDFGWTLNLYLFFFLFLFMSDFLDTFYFLVVGCAIKDHRSQITATQECSISYLFLFSIPDGCTGLTGRRTPQRAAEGRSKRLGWMVHITKSSWPAKQCCGPTAWAWTFLRAFCTGWMLTTTALSWFTLTPQRERLEFFWKYAEYNGFIIS